MRQSLCFFVLFGTFLETQICEFGRYRTESGTSQLLLHRGNMLMKSQFVILAAIGGIAVGYIVKRRTSPGDSA